jgi:GTPase
MLFDEAKIQVRAGDGGDGAVTFRREKFVPRGGPSGGDGGDGGDVVMFVDPQLNTLVHFQGQVHFRAGNGVRGKSKNLTGARGEDIRIPVPPGTLVRDAETGKLLADLTMPDQAAVILTGGKGGRGNARFASSTRQAPRIAEHGQKGDGLWLSLELKLVADIGLIGMPNAGKSTLLSVISAARPKIANYPFTTLQPNLGVVSIDPTTSFVVADLPGLIEGAHDGAGLGHQFLRHVQRTRLLIHLLDGAAEDPLAHFRQINDELRLFDAELASRLQIVVLNKMDLPQAQAAWPDVQAQMAADGYTAAAISAATRQGVSELLWQMAHALRTLPEPPIKAEEVPTFTLDDDPHFTIERLPDGWHVTGPRVDEIADRTMWQYHDAIQRAQRQLESLGVFDALRAAGVQVGDTVFLGDIELEWIW